MLQAMASKRSKAALRSNTPVSYARLVNARYSDGEISAYSVDDGHGGKIHVNVGSLSLDWLHPHLNSCFFRETCTHILGHDGAHN